MNDCHSSNRRGMLIIYIYLIVLQARHVNWSYLGWREGNCFYETDFAFCFTLTSSYTFDRIKVYQVYYNFVILFNYMFMYLFLQVQMIDRLIYCKIINMYDNFMVKIAMYFAKSPLGNVICIINFILFHEYKLYSLQNPLK